MMSRVIFLPDTVYKPTQTQTHIRPQHCHPREYLNNRKDVLRFHKLVFRVVAKNGEEM